MELITDFLEEASIGCRWGFVPCFNPAGSVALEQQHHCWLLI